MSVCRRVHSVGHLSNNLFLSAIECMDMGDEACELAYESGVLDL